MVQVLELPHSLRGVKATLEIHQALDIEGMMALSTVLQQTA